MPPAPTSGYNQQLDELHQFDADGPPQPRSLELVAVVVVAVGGAVDAVIVVVVGAAVDADVEKEAVADAREAPGVAVAAVEAAAVVVATEVEPFSLPWHQSLSPLVSHRHFYSPWH